MSTAGKDGILVVVLGDGETYDLIDNAAVVELTPDQMAEVDEGTKIHSIVGWEPWSEPSLTLEVRERTPRTLEERQDEVYQMAAKSLEAHFKSPEFQQASADVWDEINKYGKSEYRVVAMIRVECEDEDLHSTHAEAQAEKEQLEMMHAENVYLIEEVPYRRTIGWSQGDEQHWIIAHSIDKVDEVINDLEAKGIPYSVGG